MSGLLLYVFGFTIPNVLLPRNLGLPTRYTNHVDAGTIPCSNSCLLSDDPINS